MKVSVIIPAYNCAPTIGCALDSVLSQTSPPYEILVMDDGSTDETSAILNSYRPRVTVFQQPNQGMASARNTLCAQAQGDVIAFLDSDDVWHPEYLKTQLRLLAEHPDAAALFTGHVNFYGEGAYAWESTSADSAVNVEVMPPLEFFKRFNTRSGPFTSYTFCCIPRRVLEGVREPFQVDGAEDFYCSALLALAGGPVVYCPTPLAAYRVRDNSYSADRLRGLRARVDVFERLAERYRQLTEPSLSQAFEAALASHRRSYGKYLMGAHKIAEARTQLHNSLKNTGTAASLAKSLGLLVLTYMPAKMQPSWPTSYRR